MIVDKPDLPDLFNAALEIASDEDRAQFIDQTCGKDARLRTRHCPLILS